MRDKLSTKYLDGLRVIACCMVVIFHLAFFLPGTGLGRITRGSFAVTYFLMLSGFVVAIGYFRKDRDKKFPGKVLGYTVHRYLRLLPVERGIKLLGPKA